MKKAIALFLLLMLFISSTAFMIKTNINSDEDEYIYVVLYPGGNSNNSENYYISDLIRYEGGGACDKYTTSHYFYAEAGAEFKNSVEKYNNININDWRIEYSGKTKMSYPSGYFKGYSSKAEAMEERDSHIERIESDGFKVYKTYFTYSCE